MLYLNMEKNATDLYIPTFYAGRCIFITGVTGFVGKALIEKLLRSCSDVAEIYVLIRPKKGLSINDRIKKMLDNKIFDKLRSEQPSSFDKIIPIRGDLAAENLGLLDADREILLKKVSIIFHVAASVRFDEGLKQAILNNTKSTRDICLLAKNMEKLVVLLHVSTAYAQSDKFVVDEIVYSSEFDWNKMIKITESLDNHVLTILTAKILGTMPNTYTFSKKLAEQVISDYSESLPCIIIRPSIVMSSTHEPMKGWIDNFNGPVGMMIGGGKGILRVLWTDASITCDFMPIDAFVKGLIILAWKHGKCENKTTAVYNCSANKIKALDMKSLIKIGIDLVKDVPLSNNIWKPGTTITKSYCFYYILVLLIHILPAIFLDGVMKLFGLRSFLFKLQRKVYVTNSALSYFLLNEWKFINVKLMDIFDNLNADNKKEFGYFYKDIDVVEVFKNAIIGAKECLLNESMANLEADKRHYKRMEWLDVIIKMLFAVIILWILYCWTILGYIINNQK